MSDNQQFCLRWNNHQSTLVQVIDSLLSSGVLVDCTLAAEGQFLHAHKVVLCACSPYLETLLSQHYEKHPIVILKDVKFQELKSMMDYMYKGEVNISQDQLGQFLKAAESLQIKGLTDGGGENDSRDVGSTSQKRHEPTPVRKAVPHQSRSPLVLPSHNTGLTIEPSKRSLPSHLSESQPDSPIRSREGSSSPTSRKRRRQRRPSQGDEDGHQDNSCDLPMQAQTMSITTVPTSIPPLPSGSSSTITKAPPPDEDSENPDSDRLSGLPAEGYIKEKIEPQPEMLIEPKTEYMEETNNDDSVEDLTLDDDDDYENMMESGPGPSHSGNNPNDSYATWQMTGDRQDEAYLNPADTGHRDSQGGGHRQSVRLSFTPEKLAGLNQILMKRRVFSPEDIQNIAAYFKLQESKCRMWFKEHGARLRRQSCSVRISPDLKKNSSDKRKSYVLKVRKRPSVLVNTAPRKKKNVPTCESLSEQNNANNSSATLEECSLNVDTEVESAVPKTDDSVVVSKLEEKCNADNDEDVKLSDEKLNTTLQQADEIKQEELESTNLEVNISGTDENKNAVSADTGPGMHPASLKIVNNTDRFFDDLSFQKKITLLKRTENLTNATSAYAQDLAAELDLPFRSVYTWLKSKCLRNSITWKKRLSRDKAAKLSDIFAASNILTEERALMLSYELDLSVCAIRKFFERKNTDTYSEPKSPSAGQSAQNDSEAEESPSGSHGSSATENEFVSKPVVLVRHCVPSGSMSNKCNNSSSTDASNAADNTRSSTGDEEYVLKKRRFVLSLRQRKILAQQFEKTPCISPSDAAALASKSNLPVKAIYLWFHRRRLEAKKLLVPKTNDGVENEKEKEKEN